MLTASERPLKNSKNEPHPALGLALVATERLPELGYILPLVIGATVLFELIGPPMTLLQLRKAGETGQGYQEEPDE